MASARPSRTACWASSHVPAASTRIFTRLASAKRRTTSMPPPVSVLPVCHATGGYEGCPVRTKPVHVTGVTGVATAEQPLPELARTAPSRSAMDTFIDVQVQARARNSSELHRLSAPWCHERPDYRIYSEE